MITAASRFGFARKASQMGGGAPVISGTAYPGNTLTSSLAGQWYVNGGAVSGQTGTTYVVGLNDIGYTINQSGSNVLTCWSPADIAAVHSFWTPYRNVNGGSAVNGSSVTSWADIKSGNTLTPWVSAPTYNTAGTYPFVSFTSDYMLFSDLAVFSGKAYGEIFFSGKVTSISTSSSVCCAVSYTNSVSAAQIRLGIVARRFSSNAARAITTPLDNSSPVVTASPANAVGVDYVLGAQAEWFTGGTLYIRVDNVPELSIATGATASTPATNSAVASVGGTNGVGTAYVNGEYRCICLVDAALTDSDRSKIARYMGLFIGKNIALV